MNTLTNSVQLLGNVGKDVEVITLDSGKTLARTSLATNEYYKDAKGETQKKTQWHNLVVWGKRAENFGSVLQKGSRVLIQGKISNGSYEDKDGNTRYTTDIEVREFQALTRKEEGAEMPF